MVRAQPGVESRHRIAGPVARDDVGHDRNFEKHEHHEVEDKESRYDPERRVMELHEVLEGD